MLIVKLAFKVISLRKHYKVDGYHDKHLIKVITIFS